MSQTEISQAINRFNAANKLITENYNIHYFDITPISRLGLAMPELIASDGLHPSGKMYTEWVNLILEDIPVKSYNPVSAVTSNSDKGNISLYPNPVSDFLYIQINNYKNPGLRIQLLNITGIKILDEIYNTAVISVNLTNTEPGLYFLKIWYDDQIITKKIIVQ